MKPIMSLIALGLMAMSVGTVAETVYISDEVTVPLRSGPSNAHRILHRGLPSGTALEVLETDEAAGFTHIQTELGSDGWVRSQYLTSEPIARSRLEAASSRIVALESRLADETANRTEIDSARREAENANTQLTRQAESLELELAEIKRISAAPLDAHTNNQKLSQLNVRLRQEIDDLLDERRRLQDNQQQQWMLIGAGLVLAGLALGVFVKSRPRRSGWS